MAGYRASFIRIFASALLTLPFLLACQKPTAKMPPATAHAQPPARAFTLTLSSGGGFTGAYTGCTLTSDGRARSWRRNPGGAETTLSEANGRADSVAALAKALDGFLGSDLQGTGNMTTRIKYALPDTAFQWSIAGTGGSADDPEPFRNWYPRAEAWCRSLAAGP